MPGTRYVTLGGAIANDIHGKNHHRRGTFGRYVEWLTLQRSDGNALLCSPTENAELFRATIGGMGLTGLILKAAIRLMPVAEPDVIEQVTEFDNLERLFRVSPSRPTPTMNMLSPGSISLRRARVAAEAYF